MFHFNSWKIKRITKKIRAMQANRVNNQPGDEVIKKEVAYYFELATLYKNLIGTKKHPYANVMLVECYRAAANLEDAQAHFLLGKYLLEEARFRHDLDSDGIFNSQENRKETKQEFAEAHAHLAAAEQLSHIEAKRLRGLALVNGWGVPADKDAGFELIVGSIDQEGSWDKVPQIFASMGLNKPEFFSAIMQRRKSTS